MSAQSNILLSIDRKNETRYQGIECNHRSTIPVPLISSLLLAIPVLSPLCFPGLVFEIVIKLDDIQTSRGQSRGLSNRFPCGRQYSNGRW